MKVKTSELVGVSLDWAVAKCVGGWILEVSSFIQNHALGRMNYSLDWAQAGPIIDREQISICWEGAVWVATLFNKNCGETWYGHQYGATPLVAAMRCYVASKSGGEVEIPGELVS